MFNFLGFHPYTLFQCFTLMLRETNDINIHRYVGNTYAAVTLKTPCKNISVATLHSTMETHHGSATASAGAHLAMRAHSRRYPSRFSYGRSGGVQRALLVGSLNVFLVTPQTEMRPRALRCSIVFSRRVVFERFLLSRTLVHIVIVEQNTHDLNKEFWLSPFLAGSESAVRPPQHHVQIPWLSAWWARLTCAGTVFLFPVSECCGHLPHGSCGRL